MIKKISIIIIVLFVSMITAMHDQKQIIVKDLRFSAWPLLIRYLADIHELPQGTIIAKLNRCRTIEDIETYRRLNVDLIMLIQRYDIPSSRMIPLISSLIEQGADPHFTTLRWSRTPLMLSVRANKKELVNFFIEQNSNYTMNDVNHWNIRRFNLIYDKEKVTAIIPSLFDGIEQQLILETHQVAYPHDERARQHYQADPCFVSAQFDCKEFFHALYIDKMLEDKGVPSPFPLQRANPLIDILRNNKPLRKAIRKLFIRLYPDQIMEKYIPKNVHNTLKVVKKEGK